jgi:hypothetical protein
VFSLLADTRFQEAVTLFLKVKKGELENVLKEFEPDQQEAFARGVRPVAGPGTNRRCRPPVTG